jgi:hypothetical protein
MNNPTLLPAQPAAASTHLLDSIRAVRASVGDGLNDDEFTRLLRQAPLPTEAGFAFLSFSAGFATLMVPRQELTHWYPDHGWILESKERVARGIAEKYGLQLAEPPDETAGGLFPRGDLPSRHHHLEFFSDVETVIVAHPRYLKVRLFGAAPQARYLWNGKNPVRFGPELLSDLSALYQT